jgi:hypothetical protein
MIIPNLLLIAGTGTKSGKTTVACKIIEQFKTLNISAIKISPHFHETTPGLIPIAEDKGYAIYKETDKTSSKDTSRMLGSGASKVYFAKVWDDQLPEGDEAILYSHPELALFLLTNIRNILPKLRLYPFEIMFHPRHCLDELLFR